MSEPKEPKKPYNLVVRIGIWVVVGVGLFWGGGEVFMKVETYVPWAMAIGVVILVVGLALQFKKPKQWDKSG